MARRGPPGTRAAGVYKFSMAAPDDVAPLRALFDAGRLDPHDVAAIIAKTEGNGRVNDFTRQFAVESFARCLSERLQIPAGDVRGRVALVGSGGCEGVMNPHAVVLARRRVDAAPPAEGRLAVGVAFTRQLLPEEVGTLAHVEAVAAAVRQAREDADIDEGGDVKYVQVKCPLLTSERINDARKRGRTVKTTNTLASLGYSNGASALGVAVGLNEIPFDEIREPDICGREDLFSRYASSSAGVELMHCEVVLIGNSPRWASPYRAGHAVLRDLVDAAGVRDALRDAGLSFACCPSPDDLGRVVAVFAKGTVPGDGRVRGRRTTLLTDSDLNTRPARAVLNAVIASVIGDTASYVSAGWGYHQGPVGGGLVAAIAAVPAGAGRR
jgi:cyanuric acid amidohydrolase